MLFHLPHTVTRLKFKISFTILWSCHKVFFSVLKQSKNCFISAWLPNRWDGGTYHLYIWQGPPPSCVTPPSLSLQKHNLGLAFIYNQLSLLILVSTIRLRWHLKVAPSPPNGHQLTGDVSLCEENLKKFHRWIQEWGTRSTEPAASWVPNYFR